MLNNIQIRCSLATACVLAIACTLVMGSAQAVATAGTVDKQLLQRGAYLATAGDCVACHSSKQGQPYAGGNPIESPLGTIWSSNITPSAAYGIGRYTEQQFADALRRGIRADGSHLYPAMPYTSYTLLSDADIHALYAYFMHGVEPVEQAAPVTELPFPFNVRALMAGWNLLFNPNRRFQPPTGQSEQWLRGAYLTEALAHCSACHTPRNVFMAEDSSRSFAGASLGKWYAPNISSDLNAGIGGWTSGELITYLRTGAAPGKALVAGPMAEAIDHSFSKMSEADLAAMALYIKSVPARSDTSQRQPAYVWGSPARDENSIRGDSAGQISGATLYSGNCASCHQPSGSGTQLSGPPSLLHVSTVGRANPDSLIMTILHGVERNNNGQQRLMPAFFYELNDQEVALLATYVRRNFGNPESAEISAQQVKVLRDKPATVPILTAARIVIALIVIGLLWLLGKAILRRSGSSARLATARSRSEE